MDKKDWIIIFLMTFLASIALLCYMGTVLSQKTAQAAQAAQAPKAAQSACTCH